MGCLNDLNKEGSIRLSYLQHTYRDLNKENNYYLICPICKKYFPNINKIEYNSKSHDFEITYRCECHYQGKIYLISLISQIKPVNINTNFIEKNNEELIIKIAEEKKDEFEGYEIVKKIIQNHKKKEEECSIVDKNDSSINI